MFAAIALLTAIPALLLSSPRYLTVCTATPKSDAVILFVGPGMKARQQEVEALIREGVASFLLTPAFGSIDHPGTRLNSKRSGISKPIEGCSKRGFKNIHIYEDTHLEMLTARRMMERLGLRSAVLVSSPYHIRRVRLIAKRVFSDAKYRIYCRPSRYGDPISPACWLDAENAKTLLSEIVKIGWFLIYEPFF